MSSRPPNPFALDEPDDAPGALAPEDFERDDAAQGMNALEPGAALEDPPFAGGGSSTPTDVLSDAPFEIGSFERAGGLGSGSGVEYDGPGDLELVAQPRETEGIEIEARAGGELVERDTLIDPAEPELRGSLLDVAAGAEARSGGDMGDSGGETVEIDFNQRATANEARGLVDDDALTDTYDRRYSTIEVRRDQVDDRTLDDLGTLAEESRRAERSKVGQAELTRDERNELDFTETNVPKARSVKAIFLSKGVSSWTDFYDPDLTVDEHREIAARAAQEGGGKRMDAQRSDVERLADQAAGARGQMEQRAREGARMGNEEAIEELVRLGYSRERAESLSETVENDGIDDPDRARAEMVDIIRSKASGRFLRDPAAPAPGVPGTKRSRTTGQFEGGEFADVSPPIARDPTDGEFIKVQRSRL